MGEGLLIRDARPADADDITRIYNHYILYTLITFETEALATAEMAERIRAVQSRHCWLVLEQNGRVVGYAYATEFKPRAAFRHTVETSLYLHREQTGRGFGTVLYQALLDRLNTLGVHLVIAGITCPNEASFRLHQRLGFSEVGRMREAGRKFDQWIDVSYWQLLIGSNAGTAWRS